MRIERKRKRAPKEKITKIGKSQPLQRLMDSFLNNYFAAEASLMKCFKIREASFSLPSFIDITTPLVEGGCSNFCSPITT